MTEMERVIYTPPGGPPQGPGPSSEIYGIMGEANIFRMMSDFYKELEQTWNELSNGVNALASKKFDEPLNNQ